MFPKVYVLRRLLIEEHTTYLNAGMTSTRVYWMMFEDIFELIKDASLALKSVVHRTPLTYSTYFSRLTGKNVYLKLENLQKTGSFKVRGAYNKIRSLVPEACERGVIAASTGNHAQGVAYAARELGVRATIVMPETAPPYKITSTRSYGAEVLLYGKVYDDAYRKAVEISMKTGAFFIHPYDDPLVIAGQGTIGLEISEDLPQVDAVIVPVGGGGLISGIAIALKNVIGSHVKVYGVEPASAPKLKEALMHNVPVTITPSPSLADGVVTKGVGRLTFRIMKELVSDVLLVNEDDIARAMYLLLERAKLLAEGAGALPLAALLSNPDAIKGKNVVAVISGGNADLTTLYRVILRGLMVEGRIAKVMLMLKDVPGTLERALKVISQLRCNIIDVRHNRLSPEILPGYARVEVLIEVPDIETMRVLKEELVKQGVKVVH